MESLHREIMTGFGHGERPEEGALVWQDGFDLPDKADAVRFYSGKTWADVLTHLRGLKDEPVFRGAYFLEEWSVLSPLALAYYARAHLEFLLETVPSAEPNEEFTFHFLGALHQVCYMHKGSPFNQGQTELLRQIVLWIGEKATTGPFEYFGDDIKLSAGQVISELQRHDR